MQTDEKGPGPDVYSVDEEEANVSSTRRGDRKLSEAPKETKLTVVWCPLQSQSTRCAQKESRTAQKGRGCG